MLLKLISGIFKMNRPPKKTKFIRNRNNTYFSDRESLEKLSQEELIQNIIRLQERNNQLRNIINKGTQSPLENKKPGKEINFDVAPKRHVFLKFYYLGSNYNGLVLQEDSNNTVEAYVLHALMKSTLIENNKKCNFKRCGRTDKGVSAFSQVISLDVRSRVSEPTLENIKDEYPYCSMLNRLLPEDIKFYAWCPVDADINARFHCTSRMYKYYFRKGNLDIELMQQGAKFLLGTHDFRNLCKMDVGNGVTEFVRNILYVDIRPCSHTGEETDYQIFEFVIKGNAFLQHQIRYIMSVLFLIGEGKESPEVIKKLLDIQENPCKPQYTPASPFPLNLFNAEYKGSDCNWIVDDKALMNVMEILQNQWTESSIKCTMIKDMIGSLEKQREKYLILKNQDKLPKGKRKAYVPLLERDTCQSLEERVESFVKKGKIEAVNT